MNSFIDKKIKHLINRNIKNGSKYKVSYKNKIGLGEKDEIDITKIQKNNMIKLYDELNDLYTLIKSPRGLDMIKEKCNNLINK